MGLSVRITPGPPRRLPLTCPTCGWCDIWETRLYVLTDTGPMQVGAVRECARCVSAKRREAGRA